MTLLDAPTERTTLLRHALEQLALAAPTESGEPAMDVSLAHLDEQDRSYVQAVHDVLHLLGALDTSFDGKRVSVSSVQAGYLMQMLLSLLNSGTSLVGDWQREGLSRGASHPFGRAVDLLGALERRRLEIISDAQPLRHVCAAVGGSVRHEVDQPEYLMVWDEAARAWQLIGGRSELRDCSPRHTLLRELAEELYCPPLLEDIHVILGDLGTIIGSQRLSPTYGLLTHTTFHLYAVRFLGDLPPLHRDLRWVTELELQAGTTFDGQTISAEALLRLREQIGIDVAELVLEA